VQRRPSRRRLTSGIFVVIAVDNNDADLLHGKPDDGLPSGPLLVIVATVDGASRTSRATPLLMAAARGGLRLDGVGLQLDDAQLELDGARLCLDADVVPWLRLL
jgi:hypothetical protein